MTPGVSDFGRERSVTLLLRLAVCAGKVQLDPDAEAVHDLRVTIRRLNQAIRIFVPGEQRRDARKIRRMLRKVMDAAGEVRDRDIALQLLAEAQVPARAGLMAAIEDQRETARAKVKRKAAKLAGDEFVNKWKTRFGW